MIRASVPIAFILCLAAALPAAGGRSHPTHPPAAPLAPAGFVPVRLPTPDTATLPAFSPARPQGDARAASFPLYDWPMESSLFNGVMTGYYVDDDATAGVVDYMNGPLAYDGHRGTDISLYHFSAMDRGAPIIAAAPGTVAFYQNGRPDRNTGPPFPDDGNYLILDNGDGTHTWYLHLRRNSLAAELGESVARGQFLAYAGSSGFSFGPHLHFEVGQYAPQWVHRDPWEGPGNPLPSLWAEQEPYVGDHPLFIHDMGISTEEACGGDIFDIPFGLFLERLSQPVVMSLDEPYLLVWFFFQGRPGDAYRLEVRRPDNSLFAWGDYTLPAIELGWHRWFWDFAPWVSPADAGTWTATLLIDGNPAKQIPFTVLSAPTEFAPRFSPIGGRSFRVTGAVQRDTLRVSPLGDAVDYTLLNPPSFVTLQSDSVVVIGAASNQPYRSLLFQAIATDGAARADTMWYHIIDPSKPPAPIPTGIDEAGNSTDAGLAGLRLVYPNPFPRRASFHYSAPAPGVPVTLRLFDIGGRLVRTLVEGESSSAGSAQRSVVWDGLDAASRPVPRGVYFCRIEADGAATASKVIIAGSGSR